MIPYYRALGKPICARAVARFRISIGGLALFYFLRLAWEVPLFSSNRGVLQHQAMEEVFPWLWQPLFRPGLGDLAMVGIYLGACLLALLLALGRHPRWCALGLYLVAVCSYRWNFQIVSVDDGLIHLFLFWLLFFPWESEQKTVSGVPARLLLMNVSLIYLVAGLSKWTSPMWREGSAVSAVLQLPGSWFPGFWSQVWPGVLVLLTWGTLVLEPCFALLPWLRPGLARKALAAVWVVFHLTIALSMDVALANLLCLATGWLVFAEPTAGESSWRKSDRFAAGVLVVLGLAMVGSLLQPGEWRKSRASAVSEMGGAVQTGLYGALWSVGLAQQYRLLDWIDERNFQVVWRLDGEPLSRQSITLRTGVALTYPSGMNWVRFPTAVEEKFRTGSRALWVRYLKEKSPHRKGVLTLHLLRVPSNKGEHDPFLTVDLGAP